MAAYLLVCLFVCIFLLTTVHSSRGATSEKKSAITTPHHPSITFRPRPRPSVHLPIFVAA